jgi:hypothetical protein
MKLKLYILVSALMLSAGVFAQEDYNIRTIFNNKGPRSSGGYASISNKFTSINGDYANVVELYGGWYINHRLLIGIAGAATTNTIPVPLQDRTVEDLDLSYEYVQCGMMTEYIMASHRAVHVGFQLFTGAGLTLQYERELENEEHWDSYYDYDHDENWFVVAEPGVKVEVNIFKWMRFTPGVSYRMAFGSEGKGLTDDDISGVSINLGLKFGKF